MAEAVHNLLDACKRHVYDSDLALFLAVLRGEAREEEQAQQAAQVEALRGALKDLDKQEHHGTIEGKVSRAGAVALLPRFFATRRLAQLEELKDALYRSLEAAAQGPSPSAFPDKTLVGKEPAASGSATAAAVAAAKKEARAALGGGGGGGGGKEPQGDIKYGPLFEPDHEGTQGAFAECMRHQHLREPSAFVAEARGQVAAAQLAEQGGFGVGVGVGVEHGEGHEGVVSLEMVAEIVRRIDPGRTDDEVTALLAVGLSCKPVDVKKRRSAGGARRQVAVERFFANLATHRPRYSVRVSAVTNRVTCLAGEGKHGEGTYMHAGETVKNLLAFDSSPDSPGAIPSSAPKKKKKDRAKSPTPHAK